MTFFPAKDIRKLTKEEFCDLQTLTNEPFKSDPKEVLTYNIARGMMTEVKAVIHADGQRTGNVLGLMEVWWGPGDVAGPHVHTLEDEAFYVLDGELTITVPHKVKTAVGKGEFIWAPRGVPHWYEVTGKEGAHVLVFEMPGGSLMDFFKGVAVGWGADIEDDQKLDEFARWSDEKFGIKFFPFDFDFPKPLW